MPYGLVLFLDPKAETTVRQTWAKLAAAGLDLGSIDSRTRPHITLVVSEEIDLQPLLMATAKYVATLQPFRLTLASVGSFPTTEGVVFYAITVTPTLLDIHSNVCRIFNDHARRLNNYYRIGTWIPHCTLAIGLAIEQMTIVHQVAYMIQIPLTSTTREMGLVEVTGGKKKLLATFLLRKPE
jgi:2'-5' RNA ligase